jgi:L-alanine-DL-glutamate epimerase-like enolase superfamily enzyme
LSISIDSLKAFATVFLARICNNLAIVTGRARGDYSSTNLYAVNDLSDGKAGATSLPDLKPTDVRVTGAELYFLPVQTRMPLKFGAETLTSVTCARVRVIIADRRGRTAEGWGETPLSVHWAWPGAQPHSSRAARMEDFCRQLVDDWAQFSEYGHPIVIGDLFRQSRLASLRTRFNEHDEDDQEQFPLLASLVCCSPFDIALHDAYANLLGLPVYETYGPEHLNLDLAQFLTPAADTDVDFTGKYPVDFFRRPAPDSLDVWHLVGGLDPLTPEDASGPPPQDGYPYYLTDWIARDGLKCLKVKLRGNDAAWDYERLVRVGEIASPLGARHLTADFNCLVEDPQYVHDILDQLERSHPPIYEAILYVEQPFPYDMKAKPIDVRSLARRKPLLMDESADSWSHIRLGRSLGWNGVALKTCKTQTGALLSLCWAKAHGMHLMVQDLTNPMLAQISHVQLAAHADTMMGVESNAMQFYPNASAPEAAVHPGLFQRRNGQLDLSSLAGPGFGYRLSEIRRELPPPAASSGV